MTHSAPLSAAATAPKSAFVRILMGTIESGAAVLAQNSEDVETSARRLSELFRSLSAASDQQTARLRGISDDLSMVSVDGRKVPLTDLPTLIQKSIEDIAQQIMMMSKQGVSLVYALDDILDEIRELESWIGEIGAINAQTRLLSLNARIESERINSPEFKVVSTEMNALSKQVDSLAGRMRKSILALRENVARVIDQIKLEYKRMSAVGTMDLSSQLEARSYLESLMAALVSRNETIASTLDISADASREIGESVNEIVVAMQFQDRVRQRADAVADAFETISRFLARDEALLSDAPACEDLGRRIVDQTRLSEVRRRFAQALFDEGGAAEPDAVAAGEVELF